jgi:hypothetical protein
MAATVILLVLIALVGYAIERNHARHGFPRSRLAGSATAADRDAERVSADLVAARAHATAPARPLAALGGRATRIPSMR